jgi:monothiol glutaredoxin
MDDKTKQRIENDIKNNKIFLYMKGTPAAPQCGFSAQAVAMLKEHGAKFGSFDVLSDESIRQGIKEYADWPTIPQLYVDGEFIGGCDIMAEMHQNGELKTLLTS